LRFFTRVGRECQVSEASRAQVLYRRLHQLRVNEFYKKGCQEKTSASAGGEILSRDPAHYTWRFSGGV
jgi:hypothetical protein